MGVVTYHSDLAVLRELLNGLVGGMQRLADRQPVEGEVVIVSNDDEPTEFSKLSDCLEEVRKLLPPYVSLSLVAAHSNVGFGAGQNIALQHSRSQFHLILNPDIVVDPVALTESIGHLVSHPEAVMVVPQGFDAGGRYACLAKREPSVLVLLLRALSVRASGGFFGRRVARYTYADMLPSSEPQRVELASGCFMCCRQPALLAVKGFDERYFLYFEDYDLSQRLSAQGEIHEVPGVRIQHYGGRTARRGLRRIGYFVSSAVRYFSTYGWRWI